MSGSTNGQHVKLDLRFPPFLKQLQDLTKDDIEAWAAATAKLQSMTWQQLYDQSSGGKNKTGFNYELIEEDPELGKIHSIRLGGAFRARVVRQNEWMRFISLHPDPDSAYKKR